MFDVAIVMVRFLPTIDAERYELTYEEEVVEVTLDLAGSHFLIS